MPQFDASSVVEPLQCKLRPYCDFEDVIPEPSDKQVAVFLKGLKEVMAAARELGGEEISADEGQGAVIDPEKARKVLEALDPEKFVEITDRMAEIHAGLCGERVLPDDSREPGRPSKAQILSVPLRRRLHFYNWLQQEVLSPEAAPGGGSAPPGPLPLRPAV